MHTLRTRILTHGSQRLGCAFRPCTAQAAAPPGLGWRHQLFAVLVPEELSTGPERKRLKLYSSFSRHDIQARGHRPCLSEWPRKRKTNQLTMADFAQIF